MHAIQTITGQHAFATRANRIDIHDIAHALAQINRYTGHARRPISVAEHSLLACEIAERTLAVPSAAGLLAVLLHDAHEAYVGDVSAPLKARMRELTYSLVPPSKSVFDAVEDEAAHQVRSFFGLTSAFAAHRNEIHAADMHALATERRDLLADTGAVWPCLIGYDPVDWLDLRTRDAFTWTDWRQAFVDRFDELTTLRFARLNGHIG